MAMKEKKAVQWPLNLNIQYFNGDSGTKELATQIQEAFTELKAAGDKQADEIKKFGDATQETKNKINTINQTLNELKERLDQAETKMNRKFQPDHDPAQNPEEGKLTPEQQKSFFKFLREGKGGMSPEERKALVEDTTGQIIVPEALDAEIYRELPKLTVFRQLASVRPTNRDRIRRRSMTEVSVGWGKLETSSTKKLADFESDMTPDEEWIYVEDVLGLTKIGEDELEDTDLNLQQFMASSFNRAFAEAEDTAFLKGTGHSNEQPEGILVNSNVQRTVTAGVGTATIDDFIKLMYDVPTQYRRNGSYVVHSQTEMMLRTLKNSQGDYLWQPSVQAGTPNTFLGKPIYTQDDFDTVANESEIATFGDYNAGYRIVDRKGGSITRLNELYIEDGLIGFKYKRRVGGGVVRPKAIRVLKVAGA
ncbi:phage major capsid protein [Bacillus tianshenii]|nr:phage major capsid protein [Bacillus tianshenii]